LLATALPDRGRRSSRVSASCTQRRTPVASRASVRVVLRPSLSGVDIARDAGDASIRRTSSAQKRRTAAR
jgi:hypothetical protein